MISEKGFCTSCYSSGSKPYIFPVKTTNRVVYCPKCGKKMEIQEAINNFNVLFDSLYSEAEKCLYKLNDYDAAFKKYSKIIEYNTDEVIARYGRILSLIFGSTLRKTKFDLANSLLKEDKTKMRNNDYADYYYLFLSLLDSAANTYFEGMLKLLQNHGYFYDSSCVNVYFQRIDQLKNIFNFVMNESAFLSKKDDSEHIERLVSKSTLSYEKMCNDFKDKVIDIKGNVYAFSHKNKDDMAVVGYSDLKEKVSFHSKPKSLKRKKGIPYIKDEIFSNKKFFYEKPKSFVGLTITFLVFTVAFILSFLFLEKLKKLSLISGIISGVLFVFFFILQLFVIYINKNRSYLFIKPFRRK